MRVFGQYAAFYDLYYAEKDYAAETEFVLKLARRFGCRPGSLLDMGCGTGRHLAEFAKHSLTCTGFDVSPTMLRCARRRLTGQKVGLVPGNLTDFGCGKQYDLVVSMFAVMGYLVTNAALMAGLRTACRNLRREGLFVFDGWFGPAVLAQKPEVRRHEYKTAGTQVVRCVRPSLDAVGQSVSLRYSVTVRKNRKVIRRIGEQHRMRFFFVQEMAALLNAAGLELVWAGPFMAPDEKLTTQTWNVSFVARRKKEV